MCFCMTANYTEQLMKHDGVKHLWVSHFNIAYCFISAFLSECCILNRLSQQQQQPNNMDVIGATMCMLNKNIPEVLIM